MKTDPNVCSQTAKTYVNVGNQIKELDANNIVKSNVATALLTRPY